MPNINANVYIALGINAKNQVFGVDITNHLHLLSIESFAESIAISENGIIWAIAANPGPGGANLYWSAGDGNWHAAGPSAKEAVKITGSVANQVYYYGTDDCLYYINTSGEGEQIGPIPDVQYLDYGGGFLWIVAPTQPGGIPSLQFCQIGTRSFDWRSFTGAPSPTDICVNAYGNCYGIQSYSPRYFLNDGVRTGSAGTGANGKALEMSYKKTYYLLSNNANADGNEVMVYTNFQGYSNFIDAKFRAIQVLGTYYQYG